MTPLAAAMASRLESALTDMSITVAETASRTTTSLPSTAHSPISSMETNIGCPASPKAFRTALRTLSTLGGVTSGADSWRATAEPGRSSCSGTALPMITGAGAPMLATFRGPAVGPDSADSSDLELLLRAESAAKGETKFPRAGAAEDARASEMTDGRLAGRGPVVPAAPATSVKSCSMGKSRWACAIFKSPSSR